VQPRSESPQALGRREPDVQPLRATQEAQALAFASALF
jgi:hypothetical protein